MEYSFNNSTLEFPRLTKTQSLVFKYSCQKAISQGHAILTVGDIWEKIQDIGISDADIYSSLEILRQRNYIYTHCAVFDRNEVLYLFSISHAGLGVYLSKTFRSIGSIFSRLHILLEDVFSYPDSTVRISSDEIASYLNVPKLIVNHLLEEFETERKIGLDKNRILGNWDVLSFYD